MKLLADLIVFVVIFFLCFLCGILPIQAGETLVNIIPEQTSGESSDEEKTSKKCYPLCKDSCEPIVMKDGTVPFPCTCEDECPNPRHKIR